MYIIYGNGINYLILLIFLKINHFPFKKTRNLSYLQMCCIITQVTHKIFFGLVHFMIQHNMILKFFVRWHVLTTVRTDILVSRMIRFDVISKLMKLVKTFAFEFTFWAGVRPIFGLMVFSAMFGHFFERFCPKWA